MKTKPTATFIYLESRNEYMAIQNIKRFFRNGNHTVLVFFDTDWPHQIYDNEKTLWDKLISNSKCINP